MPNRTQGVAANVNFTTRIFLQNPNNSGVISSLRGDIDQFGFKHTAQKMNPHFILSTIIRAAAEGFVSPEVAKERKNDLDKARTMEKQNDTGLNWNPDHLQSKRRT